ncbi:hypothetical protein [Methylobacterium persicinum]|uniref:DUF2946 domain-containing protein n=1 Tax=Methylobacterium persicinum TaxID=374426 RepID=A0ABU0HLJ0_9HYPH|nr:hypothetical protein [Methylobacterium persicinum]MDQ0443196.1 hypothetical protein [Methylobacterium persicinum]
MIAVYALLLQAFLAFASPSVFPDGTEVLCADHATGSPAHDQADAQCHACCMAMNVGTLAPPPLSLPSFQWPFSQVSRVAWRPEADRDKTGPPTHAHSARGPPVA